MFLPILTKYIVFRKQNYDRLMFLKWLLEYYRTRTSEEMDGTLPRIAFLKIHSGGGPPITPRGWMGVDFLDHELL